MVRNIYSHLILLAVISVFGLSETNPTFQTDRPYLGRTPPGLKPELFMTSPHRIHSAPAFSPDLKQVYWSVFPRNDEFSTRTQVILFSRLVNGTWTRPEAAEFSGRHFDGGPVFSPDGHRLYFYSRRPLPDNPGKETAGEIWCVQNKDGSWSKPFHVRVDMTGEKLFFSLAGQGNLYFTSGHGPRGVGSGTVDIFFSALPAAVCTRPERLPAAINSERYIESDALISPDERYLVFYSFERPGNIGQYDLYVSFKKGSRWSPAVNLGHEINRGYSRFPGLSPEGKYLFFVRRDGIYWVSTRIFDELIPRYRDGM